jgi:hypothetical protein
MLLLIIYLREFIVEVSASSVFLVSGQRLRPAGLHPVVEQCIVVATDVGAAYAELAATESDFQVLGSATLYEYELTASKLRAALRGEAVGWKLVVSANLAS